MTKETNPVFTFWVDNKLELERKFFVSDIRQYFQKWLLTKKIEWLKYYSSDVIVMAFITEKDGLNAVADEKEFPELRRFLKLDIRNILTGINPVTKLPM